MVKKRFGTTCLSVTTSCLVLTIFFLQKQPSAAEYKKTDAPQPDVMDEDKEEERDKGDKEEEEEEEEAANDEKLGR